MKELVIHPSTSSKTSELAKILLNPLDLLTKGNIFGLLEYVDWKFPIKFVSYMFYDFNMKYFNTL